MAMSTVMAFLNAFMVMMSRGRSCSLTRRTTVSPAFLARRARSPWKAAGIVPFPGRPMPNTSVRQFMVLAVNRPAQLPQPGQEQRSMRDSSCLLILPASKRPAASKVVEMEISLPS